MNPIGTKLKSVQQFGKKVINPPPSFGTKVNQNVKKNKYEEFLEHERRLNQSLEKL
jgi:hypothetical protein